MFTVQKFSRVVLPGLVCVLYVCPQVHADRYLLGAVDSLALDQPRVTFGLVDESGPTTIGPLSFNSALLDTGANGILLAAPSYSQGENYGQPAFAFDYDGNGTIDSDEQLAQYAELGVAGTSLLDVHEPWSLRVLDSDNVERIVAPGIRAFGDPNLNIGSFGAIVGMPAMSGHVVEIDMRPNAELGLQRVALHDDLAQAAFESPATVNVDLRMLPPQYTDTTLPQALRPTFSALPVIDNIDMMHTGGANSGGASLTAEDYSILVDTGAQTMIINEQMARDMGIDFGSGIGAGGDVVDYLQVGGIGGLVDMPLVTVDKFILPLQGGHEAVFTDLLVGVLDIDGAPFDAVMGMNLLTSGYLGAVFGGGASTGIIDDDVPSKEDFQLLIDFGFVNTVEDMFTDLPLQGPVFNISMQDYELLVESGILPQTDDPLVAFCAAFELDEALAITSTSTTPIFDKVVFDFTPTDDTGVMRLDLANALPVTVLGDLNGDGALTEGDIDAFVLALTDSAVYQVLYSELDPDVLGDFNADGRLTNGDIEGFVAALKAQQAVVPPPTALALLGVGVLLLRSRRR